MRESFNDSEIQSGTKLTPQWSRASFNLKTAIGLQRNNATGDFVLTFTQYALYLLFAMISWWFLMKLKVMTFSWPGIVFNVFLFILFILSVSPLEFLQHNVLYFPGYKCMLVSKEKFIRIEFPVLFSASNNKNVNHNVN